MNYIVKADQSNIKAIESFLDFISKSNICKSNILVASSIDLVGGYVGQTAVKSKNFLDQAMGKTVVIYDNRLYMFDKKNYFVQEAWDTIIMMMESHKDWIDFIFIGSTHEMNRMISHLPGLERRIDSQIEI